MSLRLASRATACAAFTLAGALALTGCAAPRDLDLSLQHATEQGRYVVRLEPPAAGPALHQIQRWQVHLSTPDGAPVSQAVLAVDGGMPQHGHGYPTRPRITGEPRPGVYVLDGMKFSMTGWWDLRLDIDAGRTPDRAVFNLVMTETGLQPAPAEPGLHAATPAVAPPNGGPR